MSSRKSDSARKSDASAPAAASAARFAPIEDGSPATSIPRPSPGLAKPTMDTSMPPPSLPPPGLAQTPEAVHRPRTTSSAAAQGGLAPGTDPSQSTPSEKSKDEDKKTTGGGHPKEAVTIPIEELQLPKSIITRLAKGVLPPNTQIQANAILAMTKSATVFINHLANAANEVTTLQNKKTVMPADVFRALDDIEFGFMRERVEAEFAKFNEVQTSKRSTYRKKVAAAKKATKEPGEEGAETLAAGTDGDTAMGGADTTLNSVADSGAADGGQPRAKKARTDRSEDQMEVDDEVVDASDPESVPDEEGDEEEEEEEDEEAQDEEDGVNEEGDDDELEERQGRPDDDEALDDGNNSD
ncbi:cbf nf-y family transcription factor [Diaporthe amygdali]|uniref:cbf nf-y family transcription factor n=1 Tax=Phomopsis amygdali TaxID=1214568 RepID=UPI0022FF10A0|nr:cbf nf-y family transcription factor [Diaporthe amygdali]KAJ0121595.1 cbf nf-y family transcription factor [Diaporthe amygdali]